MPQTRLFRDRVVSMEQTLEGGEKNLDLLRALCRDAFPDYEYRHHTLDHERDLFVMTLESPDGRRKAVAWTRMVLFDAERIPMLRSQPEGELRARLLEYLKSQAPRSEIVVTFRHLEEGWSDTPEPRPARRRRRRGRRGEERGARPAEKAAPGRREPARPAAGGARPAGRPARPGSVPRPSGERPSGRRPPARSPSPESSPGQAAAGRVPSGQVPSVQEPSGPGAPGGGPPGSPRRRSRRRRRGRGGARGTLPSAPSTPKTP